MAPACVLTAPDHALAQALLSRGMLDGLTFFVSQDRLATVQERSIMKQHADPTALQGYKTDPGNALFLSFEGMPSQIDVPDGARHMVVGFGEGEGSPELESINVRIHDMLPPLSNSRDSTMFHSWMETSLRNEVPEIHPSERFWFDINDAVTALIELIKANLTPQHTTSPAEEDGPLKKHGQNSTPLCRGPRPVSTVRLLLNISLLGGCPR